MRYTDVDLDVWYEPRVLVDACDAWGLEEAPWYILYSLNVPETFKAAW